MLIWLMGCGGGPVEAAPRVPDTEATERAVDALCKLFEGADLACTRGPTGLMVDGRTFAVAAETQTEKSTGMVSIRGVVKLEGNRSIWTTRLRGFGSTKTEALKRSMHEWALVSGTAVVDAWLNPTARHALKAVESTKIQALEVGGSKVLRGWTLFRPNGVLKHQDLLKAVAPALGAAPQGVLSFEVTRQEGQTTVDCFLEGEPHEAVCTAARTFSWPIGTYELRTSYVMIAPK